MPIVFTTGTINEPDAGSVGLSMAEQIRDDIVAHSAWELVEEYSPASTQVAWTVFKCLAASSGLASDFFVVMARRLSDGQLRFAACEGYNSSTHVMSKYGIGIAQNNYTYDAGGCRTDTYTLSTTSWPGSDGVSPFFNSWAPSGTSTKWWLTVDDDGFTVAFNGASNGWVHVGAYVPLSSLTIDPPIEVMGSSDGNGAITRNPSIAGGSNFGYGLSFDRNFYPLGFRGDLRYNDRLQDNERPVAECGMVMTGFSGLTSQSGWGGFLGKHKRMRWGANYPDGFAFGDAYDLGGTLWVPYLPNSDVLWNTGVASV